MPDSRKTPTTVGGVTVVHWNPRRRHLPRPFGRIRYGRRTDNFGDLLGPRIVERMHRQLGLGGVSQNARRLVTVGSIMHAVRDGDVVWGTGVNGKTRPELVDVKSAQFRAVRGPLSHEFLMERGHDVPEVFGDPAILVPELFPEWHCGGRIDREVGYLPNLHDFDGWLEAGVDPISPLGDPAHVVSEILTCEKLVTSSLHGMIIADAYGIPVALVKPAVEHSFKYVDYARGVNRQQLEFFDTLGEASRYVQQVHAEAIAPSIMHSLKSAFPKNLWSKEGI